MVNVENQANKSACCVLGQGIQRLNLSPVYLSRIPLSRITLIGTKLFYSYLVPMIEYSIKRFTCRLSQKKQINMHSFLPWILYVEKQTFNEVMEWIRTFESQDEVVAVEKFPHSSIPFVDQHDTKCENNTYQALININGKHHTKYQQKLAFSKNKLMLTNTNSSSKSKSCYFLEINVLLFATDRLLWTEHSPTSTRAATLKFKSINLL